MKSIPSIDLTPTTPGTATTMTVGSPSTTNESKESLALEREEEYDSASMLSTSSRSTSRFIKPSSLRKRVTDASSLSSSHRRSGSRRASGVSGSLGSNSGDYDDAGVGTLQTRLAMQDAGKEEGSWGVGDEVRMGLE